MATNVNSTQKMLYLKYSSWLTEKLSIYNNMCRSWIKEFLELDQVFPLLSALFAPYTGFAFPGVGKGLLGWKPLKGDTDIFKM